MSKEKLQTLKVSELATICKERGIVHYRGKNRFKKDEMIEAILRAEKRAKGGKTMLNQDLFGGVGKAVQSAAKEGFENFRKTFQSAEDEEKVDNQSVEAENKDEKKSASTSINWERKESYIENSEIGTIVAFKLSSGKVKSAKMVNRNRKKKKLKLETRYGAEYIVPYNSIIWVRTGKRWPKGVYKLLKGIVDNEKKKA